MATETIRDYAGERADVIETQAHPKVSWGAIFAGAAAALGLWAMLYALGLALGLSTLNPDNPRTLESSGLFTGIWSLITPLIALFVGGYVAARAAGVLHRIDGALHGLVMWGAVTVAGAWFVMSLGSAIVGGVTSFGRSALQATEDPSGAAAGIAQEARERAQAAGATTESVRSGALEAAEDSGKVFGGVFGALFLGMASAIAGAAIGVPRRKIKVERQPVTTPAEVPPLGTRREAYP